MNRRPSNFLVNRRTDLKIASTCLGILLFAAADGARAEIVLYENDDFNGRTYSSFNSVSNLGDSGFNDRVSSVRIRGGRWQLCADAYFRGSCVTLGPGEYRSLRAMGMNDKLSSARELGWTPDGGGGWNSNNRYDYNNSGSYNNNSSYDSNQWGNGGNWGSGARAVLYEDIGLKGRSFVVSAGGVSNLKRTGFNNAASSLRIESGYWLFCSEPNTRETVAPSVRATISRCRPVSTTASPPAARYRITIRIAATRTGAETRRSTSISGGDSCGV